MNEEKTPKNKKNTVTTVILLIAVICIGLFVGLKVLPMILDKNTDSSPVRTTPAPVREQSGTADSGDDEIDTDTVDTITYQGKKYKYNDHLTNILLMGIDKTADQAYDEEKQNAGRSDVLYLISIDRMTGDYTQIKIPRDTITQIHYIGDDGTDMGWQEDHISLSYYFGDGKYKSCDLTKEAVSRLFYNIPIQKYAALNLDCIQKLAEAAGEVPVVVPNDSLEETHPEFKKGETVILTPENTETFVRSRDLETTQSAIARSERQDAYLSAYKSVAKKKASADIHFLTDVYEALKPFMVTNMDNGEFVDMMEAAISDSRNVSATLPGEGRAGVDEIYDQYIVDQEGLYDLMIQTFYKEAEA